MSDGQLGKDRALGTGTSVPAAQPRITGEGSGGLYVASQNEELLCPEAVLVTCHCPQELPGDLVKMQSHIQWVWSGG